MSVVARFLLNTDTILISTKAYCWGYVTRKIILIFSYKYSCEWLYEMNLMGTGYTVNMLTRWQNMIYDDFQTILHNITVHKTHSLLLFLGIHFMPTATEENRFLRNMTQQKHLSDAAVIELCKEKYDRKCSYSKQQILR